MTEKKRLKIGLFNDSFFPMIDGVVMVVDNYARILSKYADVTVFVPDMNRGTYDDSIFPYKVVRCKSRKLGFIDYSLPMPDIDKNFLNELENADLDIVHVHSPATVGRIGIKYAKKHGIPVIGEMHSMLLQDIKRAVKLNTFAKLINKIPINLYDKCDECLAVNMSTAKTYYEEYKCKEMPTVIHNATDMMPVKDEKEARKLINKRHNLKDDDKVFLFVGRINALKNIYFIVDALVIFKKNNPLVNFKMIYVGDGQDEDTLRKYIVDKKMDKCITMAGRVTDRSLLAAYYSRADIFLFPSLYDSSSLVQIEASSQHTPTIFIEGSVTSGTVTDGVDGILSINDPSEYAKNIEKLIKNEKFYKKLSKNAFKNLYKTWNDVVEEVYKIYLKHIDEYEKK